MDDFFVKPDPEDERLTQAVSGIDQDGNPIDTRVVVERPLTLFLNGQEIVTMMTIGDHPEYLGVGYLINQNMLRPDDEITSVEYEEDIETVVVRTAAKTNFEEKLKKKTLTSGCAQGTVFGDLMERLQPDEKDQYGAQPVSDGRGNPRLRALRGGPAADLYGGCWPPQRHRQDRRLHGDGGILGQGQDLLHHGPPDLRDGDQDRPDGHSHPGLALWLYRLGCGTGA
jgi:hypothetical protein